LFRSSEPEARRMGDPGIYEILAKIPANLLAEATYSVTVSCIMTRHDEPAEFPLVVYNALTFIAFSQDTANIAVGRLPKTGLIAPRIEWTVRTEQVDAARV